MAKGLHFPFDFFVGLDESLIRFDHEIEVSEESLSLKDDEKEWQNDNKEVYGPLLIVQYGLCIPYEYVQEHNGTVNKQINEIVQKGFCIELPNTIAYPITMMIHSVNTNITLSTMTVPWRLDIIAFWTDSMLLSC